MTTVEVRISSDDFETFEQTREIISAALVAAGYTKPRHLHLVTDEREMTG